MEVIYSITIVQGDLVLGKKKVGTDNSTHETKISWDGLKETIERSIEKIKAQSSESGMSDEEARETLAKLIQAELGGLTVVPSDVNIDEIVKSRAKAKLDKIENASKEELGAILDEIKKLQTIIDRTQKSTIMNYCFWLLDRSNSTEEAKKSFCDYIKKNYSEMTGDAESLFKESLGAYEKMGGKYRVKASELWESKNIDTLLVENVRTNAILSDPKNRYDVFLSAMTEMANGKKTKEYYVAELLYAIFQKIGVKAFWWNKTEIPDISEFDQKIALGLYLSKTYVGLAFDSVEKTGTKYKAKCFGEKNLEGSRNFFRDEVSIFRKFQTARNKNPIRPIYESRDFHFFTYGEFTEHTGTPIDHVAELGKDRLNGWVVPAPKDEKKWRYAMLFDWLVKRVEKEVFFDQKILRIAKFVFCRLAEADAIKAKIDSYYASRKALILQFGATAHEKKCQIKDAKLVVAASALLFVATFLLDYLLPELIFLPLWFKLLLPIGSTLLSCTFGLVLVFKKTTIRSWAFLCVFLVIGYAVLTVCACRYFG